MPGNTGNQFWNWKYKEENKKLGGLSQSLSMLPPSLELLPLWLCNERFLIWGASVAEPSSLFSKKNFSLSICFAGGGGSTTGGPGGTAFPSWLKGRISRWCTRSPGFGDLKTPKGRSIWPSSCSGRAQALPFLILSIQETIIRNRKNKKKIIQATQNNTPSIPL